MASETLTSLLLGVLTFGFVVPQILEYLQVSMPLKQVPSALAEYLNDAKLLEAKAYQKDNFKFKAITSSFTFLLTLLFITQGWFGEIDTWIGSLGFPPFRQFRPFFRVGLCGFRYPKPSF